MFYYILLHCYVQMDLNYFDFISFDLAYEKQTGLVNIDFLRK